MNHALIMKKLQIKPFVFLLIAAFGFTSCEVYDDYGPVVQQEYRAVRFFDGIEVPANVTVILTQGTGRDIIVEADNNTLFSVETYVRKNTLIINKIGGWSSPVKLYVQVPDLVYISTAGNGEVYGETVWDVRDIDLRVNGNGCINMEINARREIDARVAGSGKIFLEGDSRNVYYEVTGSGIIQGFNLLSNRGIVSMAGSGSCELTALDILDGDISGNGVVYFRGYPSIKTRITGNGDLFDAN
ncbi:MAG: hypothetical protein ACI9V1_001913 [Spirosomataceae bacterium]|jgi:hypothetical protein